MDDIDGWKKISSYVQAFSHMYLFFSPCSSFLLAVDGPSLLLSPDGYHKLQLSFSKTVA